MRPIIKVPKTCIRNGRTLVYHLSSFLVNQMADIYSSTRPRINVSRFISASRGPTIVQRLGEYLVYTMFDNK